MRKWSTSSRKLYSGIYKRHRENLLIFSSRGILLDLELYDHADESNRLISRENMTIKVSGFTQAVLPQEKSE